MEPLDLALQPVNVERRALQEYRPVVGDTAIEEIDALRAQLRGLRVLHLNSTATGGGVAELLNSLVPIELDCGLAVEWKVLRPDEELFRVTKGFHNALQGQPS